MSNNLENEIGVILTSLSKIITDPAVISDFKSLLTNINNHDYISVTEDVLKLAGDMLKDINL